MKKKKENFKNGEEQMVLYNQAIKTIKKLGLEDNFDQLVVSTHLTASQFDALCSYPFSVYSNQLKLQL